ncbi:hypothetical protein PCANC_26186 [Puccinia coronata f. sp. avenae]|uniref:Uncharacterized protein n=1 Tax=Puccinia coronata f. sp. avenae TaxID=200324 RepID=A0A2N5U213_9BASI|nr:hypothetical protein PCANC_26186 [Puccinia coronata f. sp. avenae]PLW31790.1 hypothetical protein PCASD_17389 [Puccinia coronata f. sp. avenae]
MAKLLARTLTLPVLLKTQRVSVLQVAKVKACTNWSVNFEVTNTLDVFWNLVLLPKVQHLDLVQPPIKFMDALPKILSEVLLVSHVHDKVTNPDIYKNPPHIMSNQMARFKLRLISLFPHTAQVNHAEWLKFCDALTSFIEKPLLLNAFKFDIALIILLLDSLYPTNDTASCTHTILAELMLKRKFCEQALLPPLPLLKNQSTTRAPFRLAITAAERDHLASDAEHLFVTTLATSSFQSRQTINDKIPITAAAAASSSPKIEQDKNARQPRIVVPASSSSYKRPISVPEPPNLSTSAATANSFKS